MTQQSPLMQESPAVQKPPMTQEVPVVQALPVAQEQPPRDPLAAQQESAVQFPTASRIHIALAVGNLERSVAFYRSLLGQEPAKVRQHYAKFETAEPPVNLALNEVGEPAGPNNPVAHFGIQVKSTAEVEAIARRLADAGIPTRTEANITCCYAVQNKVWAADPDGNRWEVYVVLDNDAVSHAPESGACCRPVAAVIAP